jgi:hypothetical protein
VAAFVLAFGVGAREALVLDDAQAAEQRQRAARYLIAEGSTP